MAWSAERYLKFEDERTRPARELLSRVPYIGDAPVFDLGCGPGNSTELLVERFGVSQVSGLDSDDDMLASARRRLPDTPFLKGDLADWRPAASAGLLFANAVFQWLPDHPALLERLMDDLVPGGALAVQMPDNLDEPSHLMMEESAVTGPWRARFSTSVRRPPLPSAESYYDRLALKSSRVDLWRTTYYHVMTGPDAIVDWVRATGLRPYLERVPEDMREDFLVDYTARIASVYPARADGRVLLAFPRLFIVAVKA
ncbi:trans-aconitate 2-methyltransferase [Rhizobium sp. SG_E_25_P2]|uniref:trans-aconitate 2-methyltransferase n=1 Tax=Rhizobium sp. SG_E_25_P2 TaxID=2879942 RepID=UPI0024737A0E|nr:trans-aconitate 2-methyltransferase [Rhizobium sp. SG_E_25_P2]MDH6265117.1 trans-aconitate 2-methyltransferase [Rhizobium sp. SG_E_25_P2]